ncbi:MAG: hypothetical protein ACOC56_05130 [Atribacterota bacterium]
MSLKKKVIERFDKMGSLQVLRKDNFAYFDETTNRWRAGKLSGTRRAGAFVSAKDAQRIRACASHAIEASRHAIRISRQKDISPKKAIEEAYRYTTQRRKTAKQFERQGIPNPNVRAVDYLDEIYSLRKSP